MAKFHYFSGYAMVIKRFFWGDRIFLFDFLECRERKKDEKQQTFKENIWDVVPRKMRRFFWFKLLGGLGCTKSPFCPYPTMAGEMKCRAHEAMLVNADLHLQKGNWSEKIVCNAIQQSQRNVCY